jgi:hypothetical protein
LNQRCPTSIDKVPSGERWIHEIKFDGYRVQVHLVNNGVKEFTRRGNDWTHRFKKIADDAWPITPGSAIRTRTMTIPPDSGWDGRARYSGRGGTNASGATWCGRPDAPSPTGYPMDTTASARPRLGPFPSCAAELFASSRIE